MTQYDIYYQLLYIRYKIIRFCMRLFPITLVRYKYYKRLKRFFSLKNPKTFNEKNQWVKFNHNTELMEKCADKLAFREYLSDKGFANLCVPILGVYDSYDEIDFDQLPNQFVLKSNHGSGYNTVVLDKHTMNHDLLRAKYHYILRIKYSDFNHELVYQNIKPRLLIEPYLGNLIDYKIMCVNHKILYTVTIKRHPNQPMETGFYDEHWDKSLSTFKHLGVLDPSNKPYHKEEMNKIALEIAKDFLIVRVDFYEINDQIFISESTFFCQSGMIQFIPESVDLELGKKFILPFEQSV